MAYEVLMPQLGLTMEEGTVSQWIKHEGDAVKAGDVVVEITTDKLTNEITSEQDGVLLKIVAQEGADVPVRACWATSAGPASRWGPPPQPRHLPPRLWRPRLPPTGLGRCWSSAAAPAAMWPPSGRPSWAPG